MSFDWLLFYGLCQFALVSSITPGPNNMMLLASGANFGFKRTIPHMLGIAIGFIIMAILVGLIFNRVFDAFPWLKSILTWIAFAYILYLAWKIANAGAPKAEKAGGTPMSFFQAALFQWVNPKAWTMASYALLAYTQPNWGFGGVLFVALIFGAINLPAVSSWTILGQQMARVLTNPSRLRAFNWTMAILLILSMLPVLLKG